MCCYASATLQYIYVAHILWYLKSIPPCWKIKSSVFGCIFSLRFTRPAALMGCFTNPLSSLNTSSLGSSGSTPLSCCTAVCVYQRTYMPHFTTASEIDRVVVLEDTVLCVTLGHKQCRSSVSLPTLNNSALTLHISTAYLHNPLPFM